MPKYNMEKSVFGWNCEAAVSYWAASKTESSLIRKDIKDHTIKLNIFRLVVQKTFTESQVKLMLYLQSKNDAIFVRSVY